MRVLIQPLRSPVHVELSIANIDYLQRVVAHQIQCGALKNHAARAKHEAKFDNGGSTGISALYGDNGVLAWRVKRKVNGSVIARTVKCVDGDVATATDMATHVWSKLGDTPSDDKHDDGVDDDDDEARGHEGDEKDDGSASNADRETQ